MRRKARRGGGRQLEVTVEALGAKGDGLSSCDGRPLFLAQTVPGDRVLARVTGQRGGGFKGEVIELLEEGPNRAEPPCPFFGPCGGCALQHLAEPAYVDWKEGLLRLALERRGLAPETLHPLRRVPPGRRRRITWSALKTARGQLLGYYERESHQLTDVDACLLVVPELQALIAPLHGLLERILAVQEGARVTATLCETGVDLLLDSRHEPTLTDREALAAFAEASDLARLSWTDGREAPEPLAVRRDPVLTFGGVPVLPPPGGFVQPTAEGEAVLVDLVMAAVPEGAETAADLFAGCGTFTFPLAERLQVYAAEGAEDSLMALDAAARRATGVVRVQAELRDLARFPVLADELSGGDVVVFDPPRNGAREQAAEIAASDVPVVIAVSCNPTTFARDARILVDGGYRLKEATPIDQFPWSGHLELVAVFAR
ncbi:class I SAM-dependent RNA methyltransferase [Pelagibius sp. CAU 1746]|uniref:class I SAM-dependent RNA methyltransferase n=1 Tax=Pelagibius sp. CAU 1746 TaxID=3140370 RepID=UPI00325B3392